MWCIIVVEHPHFGVRVRFVIWEYKKNKGNHEHRCIIVFELPAIMQSTHTANYHWLLKYTLYELSAAKTHAEYTSIHMYIHTHLCGLSSFSSVIERPIKKRYCLPRQSLLLPSSVFGDFTMFTGLLTSASSLILTAQSCEIIKKNSVQISWVIIKFNELSSWHPSKLI